MCSGCVQDVEDEQVEGVAIAIVIFMEAASAAMCCELHMFLKGSKLEAFEGSGLRLKSCSTETLLYLIAFV